MSLQLSELFREIESEKGVNELARLTLRSIKAAVSGYNGKDLVKEFKRLVKTVYDTEPKIALVIDQFYFIMDYLYDHCRDTFDNQAVACSDVMEHIDAAIDELKEKNERDEENLCINGEKMIEDGDVILIHSHSRSVIRILRRAFRNNVKFEVILAEQEFDKTISILKLIHEKGIPVKVVPEYMLSHIESEITKVFVGVITLNSQMEFVAVAGTSAVISEFVLKEVPVYVFMTTGKFSLWKTRNKHHTYKVKHKKLSSAHNIQYNRIKFSHDRVPIKYVNIIITNKGLFTPEELEKLYWDKYKKREEWNRNHDWMNI